MSDENDALIAAAACVILCTKNNKKRRFWVRPSLKAKKIYSGSDMMMDFQKDDIGLAGELRYVQKI